MLTLVYRAAARRTNLVILRGADLGPQAILPLSYATLLGFHGQKLKERAKADAGPAPF